MRFKSGLCSVSFRENTPLEILEEMKKTSLTHIEWGSDVHMPCGSRKIETSIKTSSYGTYFRLGTTPLCELDLHIDTALELSTNVLRVWCSDRGSAECEDKKTLFDTCRKAAVIAEKRGVILCCECHAGTFTDTPEAIVELMQEVSSPSFRMYWQPNQYKSFEENLASARLTAPFVENVHVFNWEGDRRLPLAGAVDRWKRYLEFFEKGFLLLEFMPDSRLSSLEGEAETLTRLVEDLK